MLRAGGVAAAGASPRWKLLGSIAVEGKRRGAGEGVSVVDWLAAGVVRSGGALAVELTGVETLHSLLLLGFGALAVERRRKPCTLDSREPDRDEPADEPPSL